MRWQSGRVVAIMSVGLMFRTDAASVALRQKITGVGGTIEPLPPGTFKDAVTFADSEIIARTVPI